MLVFAFQNRLIFPLSLNDISCYGNWSVDTELGDIHMEGMLPRNLNINWMVICQHCIWLRFCKKPTEGHWGKRGISWGYDERNPKSTHWYVWQSHDLPGDTALWLRGRRTREPGCAEPQDCRFLPGTALYWEKHTRSLQLLWWALMMLTRELLGEVKSN